MLKRIAQSDLGPRPGIEIIDAVGLARVPEGKYRVTARVLLSGSQRGNQSHACCRIERSRCKVAFPPVRADQVGHVKHVELYREIT